jgi:hypothetical protein
MSSLIGSMGSLATILVVAILEAETFAQHYDIWHLETSNNTVEKVKEPFTRTVAALHARVGTAPRALGARNPAMSSGDPCSRTNHSSRIDANRSFALPTTVWTADTLT